MYIYLLCPIIAFIIAQGAKTLTGSLKKKSFHWKDIFAYSGMPSGHTSVVVAVTTIVWLRQGINSPILAVSFVYAMITIVDAIGLRNYLGAHGRELNILVKDLREDELLDKSYKRQLENIGHTPLQVLIGGLVGFFTSIILNSLIN